MKDRLFWCYNSILIRARWTMNNAIYNCRHARTHLTLWSKEIMETALRCKQYTLLSRNSQLQRLTIVAVFQFFTHILITNVQSNGFICEQFTLKFWFALINCVMYCMHFWCGKTDAPVYEKKTLCILEQLSFFSPFLSLSFSQLPLFWVSKFQIAMQWIQFIKFLFWNI